MIRLQQNPSLILLSACCLTFSATAQVFENAGQYMDNINKVNEDMTIKYLVYLSTVSHGKSARKSGKAESGSGERYK